MHVTPAKNGFARADWVVALLCLLLPQPSWVHGQGPFPELCLFVARAKQHCC